MLERKTTDLAVLRKKPHLYTWGTILRFHEIGSYVIIEHENSQHPKSNAPARAEKLFAAYLLGKDLGRSSTTLAGALLICIAQHYGPHGRRGDCDANARAAAKLLDVPSDDQPAQLLISDYNAVFQRIGERMGFEGAFLSHYGYMQIEERVSNDVELRKQLIKHAKNFRQRAVDMKGSEAASALWAEVHWLERLLGIEPEE